MPKAESRAPIEAKAEETKPLGPQKEIIKRVPKAENVSRGKTPIERLRERRKAKKD